ncbi:MAG: DUF4126 family protein [Candidatus Sulfotelmatobacter sp.]|jgi:uncharacterized membrane protein
MNPAFVILLAFGIGVVAGLRSMTAPAVVAWAAHLGWIYLSGSPLAFVGSRWAVGIFTLAALGEFVADLLPTTPARTSAFPLMVRVVVGFLTGACLAVGGGVSLWFGGIAGSAGAIAGTFGGYYARAGLVRTLRVADAMIAIPEDAIAVALGLILVSRF